MITLGKKVCLYNANNNHELQLDECGLSLSLPDGLFSPVDSNMKLLLKVYGEEISHSLQAHISSVVCVTCLSLLPFLNWINQ